MCYYNYNNNYILSYYSFSTIYIHLVSSIYIRVYLLYYYYNMICIRRIIIIIIRSS